MSDGAAIDRNGKLGDGGGLDGNMSGTVRSALLKLMWARLAEVCRHEGHKDRNWTRIRQGVRLYLETTNLGMEIVGTERRHQVSVNAHS